MLNLPNVLTVTRLLLVPLCLLFLFQGDGHDAGWRWLAFLVFAVAAITDRYDGHIARKRGLVTTFGKVADPIADKALTGSVLISLSILGDVPAWVTVVILVREIGITLLRFALLRRQVIPASNGGKLKTLIQIFAIGLYLMPLPGLPRLVPDRHDGRRGRPDGRHRRRLPDQGGPDHGRRRAVDHHSGVTDPLLAACGLDAGRGRPSRRRSPRRRSDGGHRGIAHRRD